MNPTHTDDDLYIKPSQLCIGLYIHLDLPWVKHPFTFSSFKIKELEQVEVIQGLGLKRIRYSPDRCDRSPLAVPPKSGVVPEPAVMVVEKPPVCDTKRELLERMIVQREQVIACDREYLATTRSMKSIRQNMYSLPEQICEQATALVAGVFDAMPQEADLLVHVMSDKGGGDDGFNHALNVTLLSMIIGREMKLSADDIKLLGLGAMLHDIGDAEIPGRIKNKPEPLNRAELHAKQQHCAFGVALGKKLRLPEQALTIIAQHHERVDGSGYPMALQGADLSQLSRIVAVVNAYDEMCNPVNGGRVFTPHEAISIIYAQQRGQFDSLATATLVRCLGVYPPGTIVVLTNGAVGMVAAVNSSKPLKPTILVYDPYVSRKDAILVELEREPDVAISKTVKPQNLPAEAYEFLSPGKRMLYYFSAQTD